LFSALSFLIVLGAALLLAWAIGLMLNSNVASPISPAAQMEPTITEPPWLTYLPPVKATAEKSWLETQDAAALTPIPPYKSPTPDTRPTVTPDYSGIPHRVAGAGVILDEPPFVPPAIGVYLLLNQWNATLNGENIYVYAGSMGEGTPPMQGVVVIYNENGFNDLPGEYLTPFQDGPMKIVDVQGEALVVLESLYHKYTILFDVEHRLFQIPTVTPFLDCILPNTNGYTGFFGYSNFNPYTLTLPLGPNNFFWPDPQDRGQPTVFPPGQYAQVFSVPVGGGGGAGPALADDLVWTLNGLTTGASGDSPQCP
jgi:hypothetical protein